MKKKKNPPHFYEKKGANWVAYYHAARVSGKLVWTKLGTDRNQALRKWAELERTDVPLEANTVNALLAQYMEWAAGEVAARRLSQRTVDDRRSYIKKVETKFGPHPFEGIEPKHIRKYLDWRSSAPIVAKKEMRFFSVVWNWARERGLTAKANPVAGVRMPEETGRTIVVRDVDYWLVYECGDQLVRDVLLLAARLGTRPQEVFDLEWKNIEFVGDTAVKVNVWQNKIKKWRMVIGDLELHDQLRALRDTVDGDPRFVLCKRDGTPLKITGAFRYKFDHARKVAAEKAADRGIEFQSFQLRDIRPMAGIKQLIENGMDAARQLLGHTTESMTAHYTTKRTGMVSKSGTMTQIKGPKESE